MTRIPLALSLAGLLAFGPLGCNRKSEAQIQAEAAAAKAEARVADLEKRLNEAAAGRGAEEADADTREQLTLGQKRALERQLRDAKVRAEARKKVVQELASAPRSAPAPKIAVVDVPAGTPVSVKLNADLATDTVQAGDAFDGTLALDVTVGGRVAWPAGSIVHGVVAQSVPAGRLASGKGVLAIKVTEIAGEGVETGTYAVHGTPRGERNAAIIGGGAVLGALVGVLSDRNHKGDHALGGAAIGAGAGTAVAAATAKTVIRIAAGRPIAFKLASPESIMVREPAEAAR